MSNGSSRPPLTEGAATAIANDIKNGRQRGQTSEVPLAFQSSRPLSNPAATDHVVPRRAGGKLVIVAVAAIAVLLVVWVLA